MIEGNTAWILMSTALVLIMTLTGLALFYGGLVFSKNLISVLIQCFAVACLMSLAWFAFGYSIAFTETGEYFGNLSKAFLKGSGVSPDKLLYVTPIDRSYNRGFKQTISMAYDKALLSGDKQKIKTIEKFAKDIEVNIGKGSGSKFDFGTTALGKKTQESNDTSRSTGTK